MRHVVIILALAVASLIAAASPAAALERGMFGWRAAEVSGSRPLLVILLHEADGTTTEALANYRAAYQDIVFGHDAAGVPTDPRGHFERSAASYYREVSSGRFAWRRAGFVGPLTAAVKGKSESEIARLAIEAAAAEGGFDFRPFDLKHDGGIAADALTVLVIANTPSPGRRGVDFSPADRVVPIAGQGISFAGRAAVVAENDGFAALNRALFRLLAPQAVDLDGSPQRCFALNGGRSLMAAGNSSDPALTMHLDPWHKMLVGWIEPRVFSIGKPATAKLIAQHVAAAEGEGHRPVLLFDPLKGPREFFLLEYRTRSALGFDQALVNSGLVVWQVALDAANRPHAVAADRPNCRGETLRVPSLFTRGAPNWQLGGDRAYAGTDGPFSLKWLNGSDTGVRVTVERHNAVDWRIAIAWTAADPGVGATAASSEPAH
jgi:hypothetical protein